MSQVLRVTFNAEVTVDLPNVPRISERVDEAVDEVWDDLNEQLMAIGKATVDVESGDWVEV